MVSSPVETKDSGSRTSVDPGAFKLRATVTAFWPAVFLMPIWIADCVFRMMVSRKSAIGRSVPPLSFLGGFTPVRDWNSLGPTVCSSST